MDPVDSKWLAQVLHVEGVTVDHLPMVEQELYATEIWTPMRAGSVFLAQEVGGERHHEDPVEPVAPKVVVALQFHETLLLGLVQE